MGPSEGNYNLLKELNQVSLDLGQGNTILSSNFALFLKLFLNVFFGKIFRKFFGNKNVVCFSELKGLLKQDIALPLPILLWPKK